LSSNVVLHEARFLEAPGSNLKSCTVCYTSFNKRDDSFAEFCYEVYHVDGHQVDVRHPRHPAKLCRICLKTHCETALGGGQLYVRCPMPNCGRALQIRELQGIVSEKVYDTLMTRLREAEEQEREADNDDVLQGLQAQLQLKQCPRCNVKIEKNAGCDHMRCYRCGHDFQWSDAVEVKPKLRACPEAGSNNDDLSSRLFAGGFGQPLDGGGRAPSSTSSLFGWSPSSTNRQNHARVRGHSGRNRTAAGNSSTVASEAPSGTDESRPHTTESGLPRLQRVLTEDL